MVGAVVGGCRDWWYITWAHLPLLGRVTHGSKGLLFRVWTLAAAE